MTSPLLRLPFEMRNKIWTGIVLSNLDQGSQWSGQLVQTLGPSKSNLNRPNHWFRNSFMSETADLIAMLKGVVRILIEAFNISESLLLDVIMVLYFNNDITTNVVG